VATLVGRQALKTGLLPRVVRSSLHAVGGERSLRATPEDEVRTSTARTHQMLNEVVAEDRGDRDLAPPGVRLQLDHTLRRVPAAFDADHATGEANIVYLQCPKLAEPQTGVQRSRPYRPIGDRDNREQSLGLLGRCVASASAPDGGKLEPVAGIDRQFPACQRPAEDRPEREEGDLDCGRTQALGEQPVSELL
jgi:hypothetical protein